MIDINQFVVVIVSHVTGSLFKRSQKMFKKKCKYLP